MPDNEPKFWFPAKRYGWGWGIATTWQGALVQIGYIALLAVSARILLPLGFKTGFWILFLISTVIFILIHWWKGEKPVVWRWGD